MEKFSRYTPFATEMKQYPALITLGANFRSRCEVTEAVNYIFRRIMSREMGGVNYDGSQELSARAVYPGSEEMTAELHFVSRPRGYGVSAAELEATYIASLISRNGEQLYTSEIVTEVSRILPECRKLTRPEDLCLEMLENDEAGFLLAASSVNDHSDLSEALLHCYSERENYADRLRVVKEAVLRASNMQSNLALHDRSLSAALFGRNIRISASKAECFYSCKFKYFCQYGMKTQQIRRASLDPLEYGSVVHYVLEHMLCEHDIGSLASMEDLSGLIGPYLTKYLEEQMGGSDLKSARFIYLFKRLSQSLSVLIHQLTEEFAKSLFTPEAFELQIDGSSIKELSIPLTDGTQITVGGKIDRVDIYRKDDALEECYFNTRTYGNITLPAGTYQALRIVIGEGAGHNWWCVMFPPLCVSPASDGEALLEDVLSSEEMDLVEGGGYEMRFKCVELYEDFRRRMSEKSGK